MLFALLLYAVTILSFHNNWKQRITSGSSEQLAMITSNAEYADDSCFLLQIRCALKSGLVYLENTAIKYLKAECK